MLEENMHSDDERNIDYTPKSDVIFKILFGNQKHPKLLIHLLNSIIRDAAAVLLPMWVNASPREVNS